jgi:hypothetical protein
MICTKPLLNTHKIQGAKLKEHRQKLTLGIAGRRDSPASTRRGLAPMPPFSQQTTPRAETEDSARASEWRDVGREAGRDLPISNLARTSKPRVAGEAQVPELILSASEPSGRS